MAIQFASRIFTDMSDVASQPLFITTGKVAVFVYGMTGATEVEAEGPDVELTIGITGAESCFATDGGRIATSDFPTEALWFQSSLAAAGDYIVFGNGDTSVSPYWVYLDGQTIELYKTGADAVTAGDMTVFCQWFPLEAGATVNATGEEPWLDPDLPGNLIDYPNGRNYLDSPPGDWTFIVSAPEYPMAWDLDDATAPNGEEEAWLYVEGGPGAGPKPWAAWVEKTKSNGTAPQTFTGSIYAKRGPGNDRNVGLVLQSPHNGDNYAEAMFDLDTGAISLQSDLDSSTLIDADCIDAGDGWWWCRIVAEVAEADAVVSFAFYAALTSGATFTDRVVYTGNATSGLYFWRGRLAEGNEL